MMKDKRSCSFLGHANCTKERKSNILPKDQTSKLRETTAKKSIKNISFIPTSQIPQSIRTISDIQINHTIRKKIEQGLPVELRYLCTKNINVEKSEVVDIADPHDLISAFVRWSAITCKAFPFLPPYNIPTAEDHIKFLLFLLCLIEDPETPFAFILYYTEKAIYDDGVGEPNSMKFNIRRKMYEKCSGRSWKKNVSPQPLTPIDKDKFHAIREEWDKENASVAYTPENDTQTDSVHSQVIQAPKRYNQRRHSNIDMDERYTMAAQFIQDAKNRVRPRTVHTSCAQLFSHTVYKNVRFCIVFVHLLLAFFEPPTNMNPSIWIGYRHSQQFSYMLSIEGVIMFFYIADLALTIHHRHLSNLCKSRRIICSCIVTFLLLVDYLLESLMKTPFIRIFRFFRPVKLILTVRPLFNTFRGMFYSLPNVIDLIVLYMVFVAVFSIASLHLFMDVYYQPIPICNNGTALPASNCTYLNALLNQENFNEMLEAMKTMTLLSTIQKWPTIGRRAWNDSPFSLLFFMIYIFMSILFCGSIPVSLIYQSFKDDRKRKMRTQKHMERKCMMCAFLILDENCTGSIPRNVVDIAVKRSFPEISRRLKSRSSRDQNSPLQPTRNTTHLSEAVDRDKFFKIIDKAIWEKSYLDMADEADDTSPHPVFVTINKYFHFDWFVKTILFQFSIFIAVMVQTYVLSAITVEKPSDPTLKSMADVLFVIFLSEAIFKIMAVGPTCYWKDGWNKFDFILVLLSIVTEIILPLLLPSIGVDMRSAKTLKSVRSVKIGKVARVFRVLRVLRVMRIISAVFKSLNRMEKIISDLGYALSKVGYTVVMLFLVFYWFALLAGETYSQYFDPTEPYYDTMINFSTFSSSYVALFQIFSTSDWQDVMYAMIDVTRGKIIHAEGKAFAYVACFYFISVIWMTNLLIALVWEAHVACEHQRQEAEKVESISMENNIRNVIDDNASLAAIVRNIKKRIFKQKNKLGRDDSIILRKDAENILRGRQNWAGKSSFQRKVISKKNASSETSKKTSETTRPSDDDQSYFEKRAQHASRSLTREEIDELENHVSRSISLHNAHIGSTRKLRRTITSPITSNPASPGSPGVSPLARLRRVRENLNSNKPDSTDRAHTMLEY